MCIGGASCTLRHNEVRSTLAKALENAGYETGFEHGGGLNDERKPGDIIAYNWKGTKHLLVDVAVVNPLAPTYRKHLTQGGPGQTAKFRETKKRAKYWDLDKEKYEFHPFIVESTGALGPSALNLCASIRKIKEMKSCRARDNSDASDIGESESDNRTMVDPLSASISVTVQRHNAQMIIERQPPPAKLLAAGIEKSHQTAVRVKEWAKKKLRRVPNGNGPVSRMVWECPAATTLVRQTPQHLQQHPQCQPEETNAQSNSLTEAHITQKKTKGPRVEETNSVSYATPPPSIR